MTRPASFREIGELQARFVRPVEELTPGAPVQILANGNWPYEAIVVKVGPRLARVEFVRRKGGHVARSLHFPEVYYPRALERLRGCAVPGILEPGGHVFEDADEDGLCDYPLGTAVPAVYGATVRCLVPAAEHLCGCGLERGHAGEHAAHEDGAPL